MPVDHKEKAFENAIEHHLIVTAGYTKAEQAHFDQERAVDPTQFIPFIKETQSKVWGKLEKLLGKQSEATILDELCKAMDSRGNWTGGCHDASSHLWTL
jgi:type I restriction enzyme R subunit